MFQVLITLLVLALIFWLVDYFTIPEPFNKIIKVVIIIFCIIVLLRAFGVSLWASQPSRVHPVIVEREELR